VKIALLAAPSALAAEAFDRDRYHDWRALPPIRRSKMRKFGLTAAALAVVFLLSSGANASEISTFSQPTGESNGLNIAVSGPITKINTLGNGILVGVTSIDPAASVSTPFIANLTFNATSSGSATVVAGNVTEAFSGSFSVTSPSCGLVLPVRRV